MSPARPAKFSMALASLISFVVVSAGFPQEPAKPKGESKRGTTIQSTEPEKATALLDRSVSVDFDSTTLLEAIELLAKLVRTDQCKLVVDHASIKQAQLKLDDIRLRFQGDGMSLRSVLNHLTSEFGLTYDTKPDSVVVRAKSANDPARVVSARQKNWLGQAEKVLDQNISIKEEKIPLITVLNLLSQHTKQPCLIAPELFHDKPNIGDTPLTGQGTGTIRAKLIELFQATELEVVPMDEAFVVNRKADRRHWLDRSVTIDFHKTTLGRGFKMLTSVTGKSLVLDQESLRQAGILVDKESCSLKVERISVRSLLNHFCRLGMTYEINENGVVMKPRLADTKPPVISERQTAWLASAEKVIKKEIEVDVENAALSDVMYMLAKMTKQQFVIDPPLLRRDPKIISKTLTAKGKTSAQAMFEQLFKPAGLKVVPRDEVFVITAIDE